MRHIIIGAGVAGVTAARTIKATDPRAEVILIGEERYLPYKRYLLTDFLCGSIPETELYYTRVETFKDMDIHLRKGERVKSVDPGSQTLRLYHNEVLEYDRLLIATGGVPDLGPVLRPFSGHIQRYYSLKDALVLRQKLEGIRTCIVCGGGLGGLDLLRGLRNLGKEVTYITGKPRIEFPRPSGVEEEFSGKLHEFLESKGVAMITGDRLISVTPADRQYRVATLKHRELTADIVFAWDVYRPNIDFIGDGPFHKKQGLLVNTRLQTSEPHVYAAGDCVEIYHPGIKDYWINFGWPNAEEQGAIAGKNMAGKEEHYNINETITFNLMGQPLKARWWE